MNESTTQAPKELGELIGIYDTPYALNNGCLSIERVTKSGVYYTRLCNFAPKIVSEVTVDDGAELTRKYLIGGKDDSGRELPLVEVAATELEKMEWMLNHWDACIANANASRAIVWLFSAVTCSISADDRTGHPRKRGKQSVWTPTAIGGASPKHSLLGAKPPSPHFRSTKIYQK